MQYIRSERQYPKRYALTLPSESVSLNRPVFGPLLGFNTCHNVIDYPTGDQEAGPETQFPSVSGATSRAAIAIWTPELRISDPPNNTYSSGLTCHTTYEINIPVTSCV